MALVLGGAEVRQCLGMAEAISAVESMCHAQAAGTAVAAERSALRLAHGWMRLMPGALLDEGVIGYKEFHLATIAGADTPTAHVRYAFHLFDYHTGEPIAMLDAEHLTFMRTAAASGVATRLLAREDASTLGVIGSGSEARSHVEAVAAVRPIRRVRVYSRSPERRSRFAAEMGRQLGIDITPVDSQEQAIEGADILAVATNTGGTGTALTGRMLKAAAKPGLHIVSIGSTLPSQLEIDPEVWSFAQRIVVDTRRLLSEGGDGIAATRAGTVDAAGVSELHEVVSGKAAGRTDAAQCTLYKSIGTGLQDVAVAHRAWREAAARGLGRTVPDFQSVKTVEPN